MTFRDPCSIICKSAGQAGHMEQYRSGHNGHDWKSCVPQKGTEGSNPSCSAIKNQPIHSDGLIFYLLKRFEHLNATVRRTVAYQRLDADNSFIFIPSKSENANKFLLISHAPHRNGWGFFIVYRMENCIMRWLPQRRIPIFLKCSLFRPSTEKRTAQIGPSFLAPQKEFESPTFRLGGGRSILLSYWGV